MILHMVKRIFHYHGQTKMKEKIPKFKPIGFEVGLKLTIDWYLKNKKEADARK